jgi:hypothetical protein
VVHGLVDHGVELALAGLAHELAMLAAVPPRAPAVSG